MMAPLITLANPAEWSECAGVFDEGAEYLAAS